MIITFGMKKFETADGFRSTDPIARRRFSSTAGEGGDLSDALAHARRNRPLFVFVFFFFPSTTSSWTQRKEQKRSTTKAANTGNSNQYRLFKKYSRKINRRTKQILIFLLLLFYVQTCHTTSSGTFSFTESHLYFISF